MSELMSESMSELMTELDVERMKFILRYLNDNESISNRQA